MIPAAPDQPVKPWRSYAFGLDIRGSFPAPGLPPGAAHDDLPGTRLRVVPADEIEKDWDAGGATRVLEETFGGRRPERTIDHHPRLGYRLYARHFGVARVSADGAEVQCAPPDVAPWRWQRFLVGRVLPWASVLRGREVFHAGSVTIDGRAVACIGPTGAGKSSIALRLALGGASFLTDDVLAVDLDAGAVRAHPGAAIVSLRPAERAALSAQEKRRLGRVLGRDEKTYVEVERASSAAPLALLYFLASGRPADPVIAEMIPDARLLLSSTFVFGVQSPARLSNQLDVCSVLAKTVPMFKARVIPGSDAASLAETIQAHARETLETLETLP